MKLTVKTDILKEMVSKSVKGAGQNKLIPLTSLMAIQLKDKKLTLITTSISNYLYIVQDNVAGNDFYVVVQIEQFSKLVGKMTCDSMTLEVVEDVLNVTGNGNYKIELPIDENGELIVFPDPMENETVEGTDVALTTIKTILNSVKPSLAVTMEVPIFTRYYMGDRVIATDEFKVSSLNNKVLDSDPILIAPDTMNLLDIMTCEKIQFHQNGHELVFASPDCIVYGHDMEGVEDYPVDAICGALDKTFDSVCKLNKSVLLAVLDRISLFVGKHDEKAIIFTFTDKGVDISSKTSSGIETIPYVENKGFKPFTCLVDIDCVTQQVKANTSDIIELHYGDENGFKIVDGNITQIMAFLDEGDTIA